MTNPFIRQFKSALLAGLFVFAAPLTFASTDLDETAGNTGVAGSFLASRIALDDNDDDAAVRFLERAISLDKENAKLQQDLFASLVANGRVEDAAALAKRARELGNARNLRGYVLAADAMRKRTWKKVPDALKDVAGVDLDRALREITAAWGLSGGAQPEQAMSRLEDLDGPEWIKAMTNYHGGLMAAANGNDELAQTKLQAALDNRAIISVLTETYIRAVEALVRSHNRSGNREEARQVLDFGLSLLPNHPPFVQLDAALNSDKVLKPLLTTPQQGMAELFYNIATGIRRDGGGNVAKTYLQLAHFLNPQSDVVKIGLAEVYLQQQSYEKSNTYYEKLEKTSPFHRLAHLEMANNLSRLERNDQAIEQFEHLIEEDPTDITGYISLGGLYSREERYRDAANIYDRAVEQLGEPGRQDWNLFFRRGIAYERLKEWEKAEPNFKQSLELSEDQPEVLNYLGYSWIDQGINLDEGMEMIRKAVELRPRSGFIVDSLGWAHYRLGQYEDAVRELERAVALMPQDPTINDHLGDAYWKVGRKLEATFQWKIALASETEPENPELIRKKLAEGLNESNQSAARVEQD
jgi:tetratricopeptide (TPR) repeat protein